MDKTQTYLKHCWQNYKSDVKLPDNYNYLYGNPVKVQVPVDVATHGLMIVGAYPTAQFSTIKGISDVPVADHLFPFSNDTYFDGSRIRQVKSGEELETFFLKKLGIQRSQCWITDLVKVFLFKEGHIKRYDKLEYKGFKPNRDQFTALAKASLSYLYHEIELAQPKAILLLGEEVTTVVLNVSRPQANTLLQSEPTKLKVNGISYPVVASPHPGILMRGGEIGEKWRTISEQQIEYLKELL